MAEEKRAASLVKRLAILTEQRQVMVTRFDSRLKALQTELLQLADEKALILKQRDEELAELEAQLSLVEAG